MRLIDADALTDKFWKDECRTQTRRDFVAMVNYAPTIDATPVVRGRFVYVRDDELTDHYECSVCHGLIPSEYIHWNYCPHCGAKMKYHCYTRLRMIRYSRRRLLMPRAKTDPSTHCKPQQVSMPPDLLKRILKYCQTEDRAISWVVQKAVDAWLKERGY